MAMYVVTVTFEVDPERSEDFREAVLAQARNSLDKEARCRRFDVCIDTERLDRVFLYEIYDDAKAFQDHLASDHFKSFDATVKPWLRNKQVECWSLVA
jgi:(4S)-4-hydroxy-5-phosphonooxypentane-2,3-dione isomerase